MLSLNLLSPKEKSAINKIKIYYFVKTVAFRTISVVLIITTVFIFSYLLLKNSKDSLENQITVESDLLQEKKITSIEDATKELNTQLDSAKVIQAQYVKWTNFMEQFIKTIPESVSLSNIHFNTTTHSLEITGLAIDRNSLINFQKNLEEFSYFDEITSPISNLAQRENITFKITGRLSETIYD